MVIVLVLEKMQKNVSQCDDIQTTKKLEFKRTRDTVLATLKPDEALFYRHYTPSSQ